MLPSFSPKSGLERCEQESGLSREVVWASLSPHPAPPTPLSHLFGFVPRGEGGGPSPVGAEVGGFRARVLLPNHGWAGWVGGGERHTSLSRGVKTLLLFPVALDGLTPLPSIATRTLPVPSLESGLGRVGASPPPPSSWAGSEFGTQGGDSHPQQPNSSMQFGVCGGEDGPPSRSPATSRVWGTRFGPEDRSWR